MVYILPAHLITDKMIEKLISKLDEKTNIFEIKDKDKFIDSLKKGEYVVWLHDKAIVLGQFTTTETTMTVLNLTVANITDEPITDFQASLEQIEQEAKAVGVDRIVLDGRMGWKKIFPDYKVTSVILSKDI